MPKLPPTSIEHEMSAADIWQRRYDNEREELADEYWDEIIGGKLSWQWYMEASIRKSENWSYVIINLDHKNITVANWLESQGATYKYERNHFLIKESDLATMVSLKYA